MQENYITKNNVSTQHMPLVPVCACNGVFPSACANQESTTPGCRKPFNMIVTQDRVWMHNWRKELFSYSPLKRQQRGKMHNDVRDLQVYVPFAERGLLQNTHTHKGFAKINLWKFLGKGHIQNIDPVKN